MAQRFDFRGQISIQGSQVYPLPAGNLLNLEFRVKIFFLILYFNIRGSLVPKVALDNALKTALYLFVMKCLNFIKPRKG
ncbi:MAG: hypothetical protein A2097_12235 [Desulfobacula sp. GWF2_41_7]|nr:MAG: hypothetical protein A2097_12235 [Desulfobacula sp. GWF2_41_7]